MEGLSMSTTFWIQLLGIIFGVAMMYFTFVKYKRKEISNLECTIWMAGWVVLIGLAIRPSILDFFIVVGFFVILGLGFYNYSLVKKMERKMEQLVRDTALSHPHTDSTTSNGSGTHSTHHQHNDEKKQ